MAKIACFIVVLILFCALVTEAKTCWKSCSDDSKMLRGLNIDGCRRRRGQAGRGRPQFRCDGNIGPPCTVKRGDTVYLDVDFSSDFPLRELEQSAYWLTSWGINMPWVGLDTNACKYLDHKCNATSIENVQKMSYPIHIRKEYPRGKYSLKWGFKAKKDNELQDIGCSLFTIKIY